MNHDGPTLPGNVRLWLAEPRLPAGVAENLQRLALSDDVGAVVVLPDVHLGTTVNNGCVAATRHLIYPEAIGGDIGCGFSALGFRCPAAVLDHEDRAQQILRLLARRVPALKQAHREELPESVAKLPLSHPTLERSSGRDGTLQFGTLGCGNHFLELQRDDTGMLWAMVHSGSRAMGQLICAFHLARGTASATGLRFLDSRTSAGQACLQDLTWATRYATLNRLAMLDQVSSILHEVLGVEPDEESYLDSPHNMLRRELHGGDELLVHRKSANGARSAERSLIAGSMNSPSFVAVGLGNADALCSGAHGAGRRMSRTEARQRISPAALRRQIGTVRVDPRHLDALCDEAPGAYRDIREVMQAQRDLVRQEGRLTPLLNFKHPDRRNDR